MLTEKEKTLVEINIITKWDQADFIYSLKSENFEIISCSRNKRNNDLLYIVRTTEEDLIMLKLGYGSEFVWTR